MKPFHLTISSARLVNELKLKKKPKNITILVRIPPSLNDCLSFSISESSSNIFYSIQPKRLDHHHCTAPKKVITVVYLQNHLMARLQCMVHRLVGHNRWHPTCGHSLLWNFLLVLCANVGPAVGPEHRSVCNKVA